MTVNFDKVFRDTLIHLYRQGKNPLFETRERLTGDSSLLFCYEFLW